MPLGATVSSDVCDGSEQAIRTVCFLTLQQQVQRCFFDSKPLFLGLPDQWEYIFFDAPQFIKILEDIAIF